MTVGLETKNKRLNLTLDKLLMLYMYVKRHTKNFREFNENLLINCPESLKVFRIMLGISLAEFAKYFDKSPSTIKDIEDGRWNLQRQKSSEYINIIINLDKRYEFSKISYKVLRENYNNFYTNIFFSRIAKMIPYEVCSKGGKIGGMRTLQKYGREHFIDLAKKGAKLGGIAVSKKYPHEHYQKIGKMTGEIHGNKKLSEWGTSGGLVTASKQGLTNQENKIKEVLDLNEIQYDTHKIVNGANRRYVVDFLVKHKNTNIIIEATTVNGSKSEDYSKSLDLVNRAESIKLKDRGFKLLCIIRSKFSIESAIKLSQTYDCILLEENLKELLGIIKNINNDGYLANMTQKEINHILRRKLMFKNSPISIKDLNVNVSENKIVNLLRNKDIKFSHQSVLESQYGSIRIVDFVLPHIKDIQIILEVTSINGKSNKTLSRTIKRLETRFLLLKEFYATKSKFIGVIDNVQQKQLDRFETDFKIISMEKFLSNPNSFIY